ncbi:MAG: polysaccharide pyruvyl transferase family protein [Candidatus Nanosyncoccaceae bacterium]
MKKNVLILTLPLGKNYGGIIQAYSLQHVVSGLGLSVTTGYPKIGYIGWIAGSLKDAAVRLKGGWRDYRYSPNVEQGLTKHTRMFIDKYMNTIETVGYFLINNKYLDREYDIFITGSDQVWRGYRALSYYLFGFSNSPNKIKLSYAASFGVSDPKFSKKTIDRAKRFISNMVGVSVREKHSIEIVKKYWNVDADYHVDPALLIDAKHYNKLINEDTKNLVEKDGKIFAYVLDHEGEKGKIIDKVAKELKTEVFEVLPPKPKNYYEYKKNPEKYNLPPITQWLKGFRDADFVVTDSFHGCVFSIIYNKPFLAIGNRERGLARFVSLLEIFKLEDRLVFTSNDVTKELIGVKINWRQVNSIIQAEQARSRQYLKEMINNGYKD